MRPYLALIFANQSTGADYLREVAAAIEKVAGNKSKRSAAAPSITVIAFLAELDRDQIQKVFKPLWRPEQRTWILPIESSPPIIDASIMEWVSKNCPDWQR